MAKVLGFQIEINGTQRAISTSEELRRAISEIGKELKKATDVETIKKLEKELVELKARQNEVNKETREGIKLRQQELTAVDKSTGAYDRLAKELNEARKRYKDLAAAEQESSEEAKQLLIQITKLDGKLKGVDATVGQFQRNVGNYPSALAGLIPGLDNIVGSINNVKNATTGVGVGIGALGVAFTAFSAVSAIFNDLNASLAETKKLSAQIQNFTGQSGQALLDLTSQASAVAKTYKQDLQAIAVSANSVSKELGISFSAALGLIETGFRQGADAQGEFLDTLREYPAQLAIAGFSAKQFTAISIDAANKGVYSDKAIDAIKEFGTQTREQLKATRDAFVAAFGSQFTDKLFSDFNKGAITGAEVLALTTKQIRETGVAGKELQGLISTVFLGAGEDAGRYILGLDEVLNKTDSILEATTEYQVQNQKLYEQNLELVQAQEEYNKVLEKSGTSFESAAIKGKTFFALLLAGIINISSKFQKFYEAIFAPLTFFDKSAKVAKGSLQALFDTIDKGKNKSEVYQFGKEDEKKAEESAEKVGTATGKGYTKGVKKEIKKGREEIQAEIDAQNLALEKAARATFKAQLEGIGTITSGLAPKEIVSQAASIFKDTSAEIEKGFDKNLEIIDVFGTKLRGSFTKNVQATAEEVNNFAEQFQLGEVFGAALDVIGAFQQARAEKEQEAFDAQLEQIDSNINALEEKQQNVGRIRAKQIQLEIDAQKRIREQTVKDAEEASKKAAKQQKKLALLQAAVQGALAIIGAISAPPFFPLNLGSVIATGVAVGAQIATIAAQPLATGGVITGQRVTDNSNIPTLSNGDNVLATVRRGEVVLNESQQAALGGARTFRDIGVPGFANGGAISAPISAPNVPTAMRGSDELLKAVLSQTAAINARIDRLQAYVVPEDIAGVLAEQDRLRIQATL